MNNETENLLLLAQREQAHTALEEVTAPISILPTDLAALLVERSDEYQILGFVMQLTSEKFHTMGGKPVEIDWLSGPTPTLDPRRKEWCIKGPDYYRTFEPLKVPLNAVQVHVREYPAWFAVLRGNGITLAHVLMDKGYDRASSGSPAYCRVREATPEERETYEAAMSA
jgi:hypothetical protein